MRVGHSYFILLSHYSKLADMGKLEVVDDLLTGMFYLIYVFHVMQYFEVQTGLAIKV